MGADIPGATSPGGFPRTSGPTEGIESPQSPLQGGMERPPAEPGFDQAMRGAQAATPGPEAAGSSPMSVMEKRVEAPTLQNLQMRVEQTNANFNTVTDRIRTQNIQNTEQLPVGRADQLIAERRLGQMHEGVGGLSKIMGQSYSPPAKGSSLLAQFETAQNQFQQIGNSMAKMSSEGMNISDMLRAQSQMMKIEQTVGFFTAATGEAISGIKQLFQQQI